MPQLARQQALHQFLLKVGPTPALTARQHLRISQASFSRLVATCKDTVIVVGSGRSTRYAARRLTDGYPTPAPIYEIPLGGGSAHHRWNLHPVGKRGFYLENVDPTALSGFFDDLPYFLHDLRPAGFLGRALPIQHPELSLPKDILRWSADDCLRWLCRLGWNAAGNLIIGEAAFKRYLQIVDSPPDQVPEAQRQSRYPKLAEAAMAGRAPGSSAGGEQPKFVATLVQGDQHAPVIVKFSPPTTTPIGRRVADLLIAEHLAHVVLEQHGQPAAKSRVLKAGRRLFLEVLRFDRTENRGRRGMISLLPLADYHQGKLRSWTESAHELLSERVIDLNTHRRIRWLEHFGELIGNTDMHLGNLSFFAHQGQPVGVAPIYDMLPMLYMPQHGHILQRDLEVQVPEVSEADLWLPAWDAAQTYWQTCARYSDLSEGFRAIAQENLYKVKALESTARRLPQS